MVEIIFFIALFCIAYVRPCIALGILVNIYVLKGILKFNPSNICFTSDCLISSSPILSFFLPISIFLLILFNFKTKKIFLKLNLLDFLIFYLLFIVTIFVLVSPNIEYSFLYWVKFITIGISYYFIGRWLFSNYSLIPKLKMLLLSIYFIGILASTFSIYIILYYKIFTIRLTIPGVHPIPFSLLISYSLVISQYFILFYRIFNMKNKIFLGLNIIVFWYLFAILLFTNTRGTLISAITIITIVYIYNWLNIRKIQNIRITIFSIISYLIVFILLSKFIGFDVLLNRFSHISADPSFIDRIIAYKEAVKIFETNILGVGTGAFKYYSFLEYPHNLLLEILANYGIIGFLFDFLIILILIFLLVRFFIRKDNIGIILLGLVLLGFIESFFSFTLWMHKSLYLFLGVLSSYISRRDVNEATFNRFFTASYNRS